jgi:hypothetical protein
MVGDYLSDLEGLWRGTLIKLRGIRFRTLQNIMINARCNQGEAQGTTGF